MSTGTVSHATSTKNLSFEDHGYTTSYDAEVLQARLFGALETAARCRKQMAGMTRRELAQRACMDETAISRFFVGPSNFKINTYAALMSALEVDIEFVLCDRKDNRIAFTDAGISVNSYTSADDRPSLVAPAVASAYVAASITRPTSQISTSSWTVDQVDARSISQRDTEAAYSERV